MTRAFRHLALWTAIAVMTKELSLDLPGTPPGGKFKVRVLVGGVEADTKNVE